MSTAKITLIGLYDYTDEKLFENLVLPDGIDKSILIKAILLNSGEFEPLFANPDAMSLAIGYWGQKWYDVFKKWKETLSFKYNPFYNYDLHSESEDDRNIDSTTTTNSDTVTDNTNKRENKVSAYNSNVYEPDSTSVNEFDGKENVKGNVKGDTNDNTKRTSHIYGLKPTFKSFSYSELLRSELEVSEWNLYEHMADIFAEELLIMIY